MAARYCKAIVFRTFHTLSIVVPQNPKVVFGRGILMYTIESGIGPVPLPPEVALYGCIAGKVRWMKAWLGCVFFLMAESFNRLRIFLIDIDEP
jgi:hypothetical protein